MTLLLLVAFFSSCESAPTAVPLSFADTLRLIAEEAEPFPAKWTSELAALYEAGRGGAVWRDTVQRSLRVVPRPLQAEDWLLRAVLEAKSTPPEDTVVRLPVDCDSAVVLLRQLYAEDGRVRGGGVTREAFIRTTGRIRAMLTSLLETCEWPTSQTKTIWWLVHHNMLEYAVLYYPALRKRVGEGGLSAYNLAYLEDRILERSGFPQLYGTQICDGHLCPIFQPDSVDVRRRAAGFTVDGEGFHGIESECSLHGLDWPTERARMRVAELWQ